MQVDGPVSWSACLLFGSASTTRGSHLHTGFLQHGQRQKIPKALQQTPREVVSFGPLVQFFEVFVEVLLDT